MEAFNRIMGCVEPASFTILVNGEPSTFLEDSRRLHQGCPLSPLLFMLIIEGLSGFIKKVASEKRLEGIRVIAVVKITHLLFVDDVLPFGIGLVG